MAEKNQRSSLYRRDDTFGDAMNWEAISAIGQIVGAIAVVATLLYLSRDIRDNSRSLAVSALRDTTEQWNHWGALVAQSADLAEIVERGNKSFSDLTGAEALRYGAYVQSFFDIAESFRRLIRDYKIGRDLSVLEAIVTRRLALPGFAKWWQENTQDYDPAFVSWIEEIRAATPVPDRLGEFQASG